MKRLLTGCPICGGKLRCDKINQYVNRHTVKKKGELTKTCEKINYGEITSSFCCTKKDCYFSTNTD